MPRVQISAGLMEECETGKRAPGAGGRRSAAWSLAAVLCLFGGVAMAQAPSPPAPQAGPQAVVQGAVPAGPITAVGGSQRAAASDYPTTAIADYVFACMQVNGNTRQALRQCSCSFDVVASLIPYERYVAASTYLSMGQVTGEKGVIFRTSEDSKKTIGDLRRAQAEGEIRCFE